MLRHLNQKRDDGTPYQRAAECDPTDSVFVVLFGEEVDHPTSGAIRSWTVASVWLTVGEAQGAANRYVAEGHKALHGWNVCLVMEYQTGQLAPSAERHGDEYRPPKPAVQEPADELADLELRVAQLKAKRGQTHAVLTTGGAG